MLSACTCAQATTELSQTAFPKGFEKPDNSKSGLENAASTQRTLHVGYKNQRLHKPNIRK